MGAGNVIRQGPMPKRTLTLVQGTGRAGAGRPRGWGAQHGDEGNLLCLTALDMAVGVEAGAAQGHWEHPGE